LDLVLRINLDKVLELNLTKKITLLLKTSFENLILPLTAIFLQLKNGMQSENNDIHIRLADADDFESIFEIWSDGLDYENSTLNTALLKETFYSNFLNRKSFFNFWVYQPDKNVTAWCSILRAFSHPLKATSEAEVSLYVEKKYRNSGIGEILMKFVFNELSKSEIKNVWGFAKKENSTSIKMCQHSGMVVCGETLTKKILIKEF
jgi:L-amino acid N-acyltransferase YncA